MTVKYPTDIATDNGWERVHYGHGIHRAALEEDLRQHAGAPRVDDRLTVEEVWMRFVPRVKWCAQFSGFGCDLEGEWHAHWEGVRPGGGDPLTLVRWSSPTTKSELNVDGLDRNCSELPKSSVEAGAR